MKLVFEGFGDSVYMPKYLVNELSKAVKSIDPALDIKSNTYVTSSGNSAFTSKSCIFEVFVKNGALKRPVNIARLVKKIESILDKNGFGIDDYTAYNESSLSDFELEVEFYGYNN